MKARECHHEDYQKLVKFWNDNSGWDTISQETWEQRFINAPFGPSIVVVVEDDNMIVAQLIFIQIKIKLGDKTVLGCRPFAAVIHCSFRSLKAYKYMVQLYTYGYKLMKQKGCDLLIMLPDPRWRPIIKFINAIPFNFPLYKKELRDPEDNPLKTTISTQYIDFDHPQISDLWDAVKEQNVFMVLRDKESLKWKNSHRNYKIIGVFNEEELVGLGTILEKVSERQIQICDLLYKNEVVKETVIEHLSEFINKEYSKDERFYKMVILTTDSIKNGLLNCGYVEDNYQFLLAISRINKKLSKESINIAKWYIAAND